MQLLLLIFIFLVLHQAVKNLVFLARLLPHIEDSDNGLSLSSLINKMLHIAAYEAGHYPKQSLKVGKCWTYSYNHQCTTALLCIQVDWCSGRGAWC